jgi:hypothetical protein
MELAEHSLKVVVGNDELMLHPLDSVDVALTPAGFDLVRRAAITVLGGRMPVAKLEELSLHQVLAVFTDLVCWEEASGRLFMCADLPGHCYCLPVPAGHWTVLTRGQTVH